MSTTLDFKSLLAKHPKLHIHYHDNGSWILFKERPTDEEAQGSEELCSAELNELASGSDIDSLDYLPPLVAALADALGITTDSV